jgi:Fe-S oxidoreductase
MSGVFLKNLRKTISGIKRQKILYYPGCLTLFYMKEVLNNYKSLLDDLGVDYIMIKDMPCCGSPLINAGYKQDFESLKKNNMELLRQHGISKIITSCPHCYDVFKNHYSIDAEHITQVIERNKHKLVVENHEDVAYHDPCLLTRKNKVIKEPRSILKQTGFKLIEPSRSREKTFCCGAGGGMKQNSPKIANKIAKERLGQLGSKKIIVSCPYCYLHLKENSGNKKKVLELGEVLVEQ